MFNVCIDNYILRIGYQFINLSMYQSIKMFSVMEKVLKGHFYWEKALYIYSMVILLIYLIAFLTM